MCCDLEPVKQFAKNCKNNFYNILINNGIKDEDNY
jgi:hypothetical protein